MGDVSSNLGNYQQAINYYSPALSLWQDIGEKAQAATTFQRLAQLYTQLGDIDTSLSYQKQALSLWEELNEAAGKAEMLSQIGLTYYANLDDPKQSLSYYEQALSLWHSLNKPAEEASILNAISSIYYWSKNYQQAQEYLNRSLQLLQGRNLPDKEADTLTRLAMVYSLSGKNDKALEYVNRAIAIVETLPQPDFKALEFARAGNIYYSLSDYEKALKYHNQALQLWQGMENLSAQGFELAIIARIERDRGNLNQSLTNIEAAIKIIEELRSKIGSQELRTSYFATVQDYYKFYIDLLMQLHKTNPNKGYNALALHASERSKARSLLELLTEANANIRQGVDSKLLAQERNLQQQLNAAEQSRFKLLQSEYTDKDLDNIKQKIEDISTQLQQVEGEIRVKSPQYAALKYPQPLNLREIQQQVLDDNTILLEYSLGEEHSYLWAVTKTGLTTYELPARADIETAAKKFRQLITDSDASLDLELVAQTSVPFSQIILAPVAQQLGNKRLLIVGDGVLQSIPFAALPIPTSPPAPLLQGEGSNLTPPFPQREGGLGGLGYTPLLVQNEIVTLPSASTIAILRKEIANRTPAPKALAVIADPVFSRDDSRFQTTSPSATNAPDSNARRSAADIGIVLDRLPYTRQEAEAILALVPENQRTSAFDFAASRPTATKPDLSQYRIVHFATHGLINSVRPELSGVVLSLVDEKGQDEDGFLRLGDIFNLNLPAELVVLSACETGLGKDIKGEGLIGLTRGFMYAGAKDVAVSLWSVNDAGTSELMKKYYQNILQKRLNPVAAMRAAQLEMMQSEQWQAPYYWAPFVVQGEWRE